MFARTLGMMLLFLVVTAKTCEDHSVDAIREEEAELNTSIDSIRQEFQSEHLSETDLAAFEEKAKQKLADYADYFLIVSDTSLDTSFRNQAGAMIRELFYTGETPAGFPICLNSRLFIDSMAVAESLHRSGKQEYTGVLAFRQECRSVTTMDTIIVDISCKRISVYAAKTVKIFGNDTLLVWNVFLGKIF